MSLSLISCTRQVKGHLIFLTPAGHLGNYTGGGFAARLYSHLRECGGADPGRRCEGSPCLSHCSLSVHEFPLDCPKLAILLLYTHGCIHSYTQIQTKLQVHQALPENVRCKHLTWQTHTTLHKHKQAKDNKLKRKKTPHNREDGHYEKQLTNTYTYKLLNPKYLLHRPHMQQNQRNSSIWYQYSVRRKITLQVSVDDCTISHTTKEDGENVQKYGRKNPILCT